MSRYYQGEGARAYDRRYAHFTHSTLSETLRLLDDATITRQAQERGRPLRLLDVACGTGVLLSLLHKRFPEAELSGTDGSQDMLALAHQRLKGIQGFRLEQVVIGSSALAGLPYPSESFDLITCTNALCTIPSDPVAVLTELHRLLAPGGHLLLEDVAWRPPLFPWWLFQWLVRRAGAAPLHPYTQAEAHTLCEQAGLSIQASHTFVIGWLLRGWVMKVN